jgi:uncharacterized Zn-binding protein involved in type VI secretion
MINQLAAARVSDKTVICSLPACIPNGMGFISKGSLTVMINNLAAGRQGDVTTHPGCVAPIGAPKGTVLPPCSPNVIIGG